MSFNSNHPESGSNIVKPISLGGWKVRDIHGVPSLAFYILVSVVLVTVFFLPKVWNVLRARSWVKTPCVIEVSWVGKKGDRYEVKIKYSYRSPDGKKHIGEGYNFAQQTSAKTAPKQKIVDKLPAGSSNYCYVSPNNPDESIFRRSADKPFFMAAAALILVPLSVVAFTWAVLWRRKAEILHDYQEDVMKGLWAVDPQEAVHGPEKTLKPHKPEIGVMAMFAVFLIALGIWALVEITEVFGEGSVGNMTILGIFALPNVIGLAYYLIRRRNPVPEITMPDPIRQGAPFVVKWRYGNGADRTNVRMKLEGREKVWWGPGATYGSSKQNTMRSRVTSFRQIPVFDATVGMVSPQDAREVTIPLDTMHSLDGHRNAILWKLILEIKTEGLPKLTREYPVAVLPAAFDEQGAG